MDSSDSEDFGDVPSVVKRMLKHFELASEAENDNRTRGLLAQKFALGGADQWDRTIYDLRGQGNQPRESYNQIPQFTHQVTNDMRMNMPQTKFIPGDDSSAEKAEILEDIVRNIQTRSEAEVAYDAAVASQVNIGWGYWRYVTKYENDKTFDQIIDVQWIPNPFTCYDDPYAMLQDRSDRKKFLQVCDMPLKDFNAEYDKDYDSSVISSIGDSQPQWATDNMIRVAEYWEVHDTVSKLYRQNGKITKEKPKGKFEERDVITPKVMWYKCTAREILETKEWPGIFIPYVSIVGEQTNVDGRWVLSGLVEGMMSAQKQYNYWTNAATEMAALAPKNQFILDPVQIEGMEKYWDQSNVKNYPYLPAKRFVDGKDYGLPGRAQNGADINSMLGLVQQSQQNFYATTGIYPASLGQSSNEKSGKAIIARQKEGDVSTFHYSDNLARGQRFGGRILEDLIKKIYDGARTVRGTKEDKSTKEYKINQRYTDPDSGESKEYDMTVGTNDVVVTTGPSFTTKRAEAAESMIQAAQAYPPLFEVAGPEIVRSLDWPGADKIAELLEAIAPPQLQAVRQSKGKIPPEVQAQLNQAQQIIQQLTQQIQVQGQELESAKLDISTKQADLQAKVMENQQTAQNQAFKDQVAIAQKDLENRSLKVKMQEQELEHIKAELAEYAKQAAGPRPMAQDMEVDEDMMSEEALLTQLEVVRQQKADKEAQMQQQQEQAAMAQQAQAMKDADNQARSDALLNGLAGIQGMLGQLTQSIAAPKVVVRDPTTGAIQGVVTEVNSGING